MAQENLPRLTAAQVQTLRTRQANLRALQDELKARL
jgi:hypothetical protein